MEYDDGLLQKTFQKNFSSAGLEKKLGNLPGRAREIIELNSKGVPIDLLCDAYKIANPSAGKVIKNKIEQNKKAFDARSRLRAKLEAKNAINA